MNGTTPTLPLTTADDLTDPLAPMAATHSLFEEPWWMDCVAPGAWSELTVQEHGQTAGRMVVPLAKRWGMTLVQQPALTHTLGPWVRAAHANVAKQLAFEKDVLTELIGSMPPADFYSQNFHRSVVNWLPFHWKGYTAYPKITYVLPDLTDTDALWAQVQGSVRTDVKKARKQVEVVETDDMDEFLRVNRLTFERQGAQAPHDEATVRRLDAACAARGKRRILLARDEQGRTHAGVYLVMDSRCTYYMMGGGDPALRSSGAGTLLVWEAIERASRTSREFDFEGSMSEPIERFFRAFGPRQQFYLNVRGARPKAAALGALRDLMRALKGR